MSFTISRTQSGDIEPLIRSFAAEHNFDVDALIAAVANEIARLGLTPVKKGPLWSSKSVFLAVAAWGDTQTKSASQLDDAESETDRLRPVTPENSAMNDSMDRYVYFMGDDNQYMATNPHVDLLWLRKEELAEASSTDANQDPSLADFKLSRTIPSFIRRGGHRIIIYQTRGAKTGGSYALRSLYFTLQDLGFDVTECWESNHLSPECTELTGIYIVYISYRILIYVVIPCHLTYISISPFRHNTYIHIYISTAC